MRTSEEDVTLRIVAASFVLLFLCSNTDLFVFFLTSYFFPSRSRICCICTYVYICSVLRESS